MPRLWFCPWSVQGCLWEETNWCFSLASMFLSLPSSLSPKSNEGMSSGRDIRKTSQCRRPGASDTWANGPILVGGPSPSETDSNFTLDFPGTGQQECLINSKYRNCCHWGTALRKIFSCTLISPSQALCSLGAATLLRVGWPDDLLSMTLDKSP